MFSLLFPPNDHGVTCFLSFSLFLSLGKIVPDQLEINVKDGEWRKDPEERRGGRGDRVIEGLDWSASYRR